MDTAALILEGFQAALAPEALLYCFIGVTVGTLIGVLPGIGPLAAVSMLLPLTFYLDALPALIMLAGVFYGSMFGGSTASILLNLPGTASAAVIALDGYPMARQGKAGVALFITSVSSFVGGTLAIVLLMAFAPLLARMATQFTSAEYFSIMLLGLVAAATLTVGSATKGLAMVVLGCFLGLVGTDLTSGGFRFVFGIPELYDGLNMIAVAMGLFGVAEILSNIGRERPAKLPAEQLSLRAMIPSRAEMREATVPTLRGWGVGSFIGMLPGTGPAIASFMSYAVERMVSRTPERFGKGAIAGISAPEAANNASVQSAFIPTLSLGVPGDATMAILLGAMMIHGIAPGPQFLTEQPLVFWTLVGSFWVGNILLLVLNIPLIGLWVRVLTIPYTVLYPAILFFICTGVYSVRNNPFDVLVVVVFGVIGMVMNRYRYPAAALLLGFILAPMMEQHFRRVLLIGRGDFMAFLNRPISATFLALAGLLVVFAVWRMIRAARRGDTEAPAGFRPE